MPTIVFIDGETIRLTPGGGGLTVESSAVVSVQNGPNEHSYELTIEYDATLGRLVATRVTVERPAQGTEVTSRVIREITIQEVINDVALKELITFWSADEDGPTGKRTGGQVIASIKPAKGRRRVDVLDDVRLVSEIARIANLPHLVTIAKSLDVSHSTAKRLVSALPGFGDHEHG